MKTFFMIIHNLCNFATRASSECSICKCYPKWHHWELIWRLEWHNGLLYCVSKIRNLLSPCKSCMGSNTHHAPFKEMKVNDQLRPLFRINDSWLNWTEKCVGNEVKGECAPDCIQQAPHSSDAIFSIIRWPKWCFHMFYLWRKQYATFDKFYIKDTHEKN